MKKFICFAILLSLFIFMPKAKASSYTPSQNLYDSTQANYLVSMAYNQVKSFTSQSYVVFQLDNDYYLVTSKDVTISNNKVTFSNSTIIRAIRNTSGSYYNYYSYSTTTETSTTINLSYVVLSNLKISNTIQSSIFEDYKFHTDLRNIGIFVLGLCFALFLTKERRF